MPVIVYHQSIVGVVFFLYEDPNKQKFITLAYYGRGSSGGLSLTGRYVRFSVYTKPLLFLW